MSAEAVKVIVRCRPMNEREEKLSCKVKARVHISNFLFRVHHGNGLQTMRARVVTCIRFAI